MKEGKEIEYSSMALFELLLLDNFKRNEVNAFLCAYEVYVYQQLKNKEKN